MILSEISLIENDKKGIIFIDPAAADNKVRN